MGWGGELRTAVVPFLMFYLSIEKEV